MGRGVKEEKVESSNGKVEGRIGKDKRDERKARKVKGNKAK